ncbi:DUF1671-domain-containing protein [Thelephora ganbajun]|uniref:DUF1671-domain-containing protein n=1 Tax=Thelephora ganbajun TaxID=370292 RepID=A0ACB6ZTQ8_THEGA|nr:DUF1671-domain-containing protein [Thelephora ganbajun]
MSSVKGGRDEVEFLYSKPPEPFSCQFCGMDLSKLKEGKRQAHYEDHLSNQGSTSSSGPVQNSPSDKKNVFWCPSSESLPPSNVTPNLIPTLKKALIVSHQSGVTRKAVLCYDKSVYVGVERWDLTWGCGYRNFLMACVALMEQTTQPGYVKLLKKPIPPGVDNLQRWIENAWDLSYDAEGASQLRRQLLGTSKWIGTAELYVAFISRGVPCELVDFHSDQTDCAAQKVVRWITNYFSPSQGGVQTVHDVLSGAVTVTKCMPVVLQHVGHSRTVVGYEIQKNGECNLLVFDPSKSLRPPLRAAVLELSGGLGTSSHTSRDRKLVARIKDTMLHPINEMKARKRKESPGVIDLTSPTQKRSRSTSGNAIIVVEEDTETPQSMIIDGERQPDRSPSVEIQDERSLTKGDMMKHVLNWSRLSVKQIRRRDKYQILHFPLTAPLTDGEKSQRKVVTSLKL